MNNWTKGTDTEGRTLVLNLPMALEPVPIKKGKNAGKMFQKLAEIGSSFGGDCIGTDAKGNRIMAKVSIYLKSPEETQSTTKTPYSIG